MRCRSFSIYRKTNQRQLPHLQMPFYRPSHRIHIWQYVQNGYFLYLTIAASLICRAVFAAFLACVLLQRKRIRIESKAKTRYHIGVPFSKCQQIYETSINNTNFNKFFFSDCHCRFIWKHQSQKESNQYVVEKTRSTKMS